jgi:hypothetical protein
VQITHMTLAKVEYAAVSDAPEFSAITVGIDAFLGDHISELRAKTTSGKTPPGRFTDPETQVLFRDLFSGTDEAFLGAADNLTKRLIAKMDKRAARGLLICLRAHDDRERYSGVLKLQVVAKHAAVLEEVASGKLELSAVTDLLDKPGDLQKGALSASGLADDRVMVGDQLIQVAAYFAAAFGIKTYSRPSASVDVLFTAINSIAPGLALPIAKALPTVQPGEPDRVLESLAEKIADLTPNVQANLVEALANQARPVAYIDTSRPARETIKAGKIIISGPVEEMRQRVQIDGDAGAGWIISVDSDDEPWRTSP